MSSRRRGERGQQAQRTAQSLRGMAIDDARGGPVPMLLQHAAQPTKCLIERRRVRAERGQEVIDFG